jgi:hypothetical protein
MKVGCVSADITPNAGVELAGYVAREQPSTGVHDPLAAQALYIETGASWLLWLHADVLGFERSDVQRLKATLADYFGAPPERVIVTATHTHAAPPANHLLGCGAYDPDFVRLLHDTFVGLAARAIAEAEPVEMLIGEGRSGLGVDRRGGASAHTDPRLPVFAWKRADGTFSAVLALYAMHNVAMGAENRLVSADVAGRFQRRLSDRLPGGPPVLLVNGACGNINPPSVGGDFERVAEWGDQLAEEASRALAAALPAGEFTVEAAIQTLRLAPNPPSESEIAAGEAWAAEQARDAAGAFHDRLIAVGKDWTHRMREPDPDVQARNAAPADVQVVTFGDTAIVAIGAEVFSVMNDDIRLASGRAVYVAGYANGDAGYLCPDAAFDEGGYEPDDACHYYGTRRIPRGAHLRVRDAAVTLLASLPR